MAFDAFWPAGVAVAVVLGWSGFGSLDGGADDDRVDGQVRAVAPDARPAATGNASFDAYRADMLDRLEDERASFEGFLGRLRDAKDQSEFDRFMEDRARHAAGRPIADESRPGDWTP